MTEIENKILEIITRNTKVLNDETHINGYPFACGVMKSTIQQILVYLDQDSTEFENAFQKHNNI